MRDAILFVIILLGIALSSLCQSGDQGSIGGTAFDDSGAVVVGAQVHVRNLGTSFVASTTTDDLGLFRFPVLPVGLYELTAGHSGFATAKVNQIDLTVGAQLTLTLRFSVAGGNEATNVTDAPPILEKSRSQLSTTIDNLFISELPVNGRDFTAFVLLTPGVTRDVRGGLSFAGQRAMNSLLLDGVNNDDPFWGQPTGGTGFVGDGRQPYYISQDAVGEFQVNSNAYSAEFGRAGGGVVNAVTKSGTKDFYGSGFWFYRDKSLNANDPINKLYGLPRSPFHYNQFGGTLGGPIHRNRLFFFANYEGLRQSLGETFTNFVPNAAFRAQVLAKSPALKPILDAYPVGQTPIDSITDQLVGVETHTVREDAGMARFDYRFDQNNSAYVRYNVDNAYIDDPTDALGGHNVVPHVPTNIVVQFQHTFSPTLINEAKFGFNRANYHNWGYGTSPVAADIPGFDSVSDTSLPS